MAIAHLARPTELLVDNSVLVSSYILTQANLRENITFCHHQSVDVSLYFFFSVLFKQSSLGRDLSLPPSTASRMA